MIKEKIFYTVICDNCGCDAFDGEEVSAWSEPGFAEEMAEEEGWIEHNGENYCPGCYYYDYNDNIQVGNFANNPGTP